MAIDIVQWLCYLIFEAIIYEEDKAMVKHVVIDELVYDKHENNYFAGFRIDAYSFMVDVEIITVETEQGYQDKAIIVGRSVMGLVTNEEHAWPEGVTIEIAKQVKIYG